MTLEKREIEAKQKGDPSCAAGVHRQSCTSLLSLSRRESLELSLRDSDLLLSETETSWSLDELSTSVVKGFRTRLDTVHVCLLCFDSSLSAPAFVSSEVDDGGTNCELDKIHWEVPEKAFERGREGFEVRKEARQDHLSRSLSSTHQTMFQTQTIPIQPPEIGATRVKPQSASAAIVDAIA